MAVHLRHSSAPDGGQNGEAGGHLLCEYEDKAQLSYVSPS